jgi:hypothetical protein
VWRPVGESSRRLLWRRRKKTICTRLDRVKNKTIGGVRCGECYTEVGGAWGPASRQLCRSGGDGSRSGGVWRRAGAGKRAAHVGCAQAPGPRVSAWAVRKSVGRPGKKKLGRARENSADLDLKRISKLNTI